MVALLLYGLNKACINSETGENVTPSVEGKASQLVESLTEILKFYGAIFIVCLVKGTGLGKNLKIQNLVIRVNQVC